MARKVTGTQAIAGFAVTLAVIFAMTAVTWLWPDAPAIWTLGPELLLFFIVLAILHRRAKANPEDW